MISGITVLNRAPVHQLSANGELLSANSAAISNSRDRIPDLGNALSLKWQKSIDSVNPDRLPLLPLWIADMDFETVPTVREALQQRIANGVYGYSYTPGSYKTAVSEWFKDKFNYSVRANEIVPFSGVIPAIITAIHAFTNPGDGIILQTPVYHPFYRTVSSTGRRLIRSPLIQGKNRFEIDFEAFEKTIEAEHPALFILCSPHNPTGRVFSKDEIFALTDICLKHGVFVVADEIHSDIVFPSSAFTSVLNLENDRLNDRLIVCTSPSKTFNLAGIANANIFIKNAETRTRFLDTAESLGLHGHGPNFIQSIAAETAYRTGSYWLKETLSYIKDNLNYAYHRLDAELPDIWHSAVPEGTYFLWLDFRKYGLSDTELERLLLTECRIQANQGYIFGKEGSGFVRINAACPRAILKEAIDRLVKVLKC